MNQQLYVSRKSQRTAGNYNYYFTPSIGLTLYNGKVLFPDDKSFVLEFPKSSCLSLYHLLLNTGKWLEDSIKRNFIDSFSLCHGLCFENFKEVNDTFRIRVNFGNSKNIKVYDESGDQIRFTVPNKNAILQECTVEIKNAWKQNGVLGYNIELREIKHFF